MIGRMVSPRALGWVAAVAVLVGAACGGGSKSADRLELGGVRDEPTAELWRDEQPPPSGDAEDEGVEAIGLGYYEFTFTNGDLVIELDSASVAAPAFCGSRGYKGIGAEYELGYSAPGVDPVERLPYLAVDVQGAPGEEPLLIVWLYEDDPDDPRQFFFHEAGGFGAGEVELWMDGSGAIFDVTVRENLGDDEARVEGYVSCELEQV